MNAAELRLFRRLLAEVQDRRTTCGHRAIVVTQEPYGHCRHYETGGDRVKRGTGYRLENRQHVDLCGPKCLAFQAVIAEAEALLAAASEPVPTRLGLMERAS